MPASAGQRTPWISDRSQILGGRDRGACSPTEPAYPPRDAGLLACGDGFDAYAKRGAALLITRLMQGGVMHTNHDTVRGVGGVFAFAQASLPPQDHRPVVRVDASSDGSPANERPERSPRVVGADAD